MKQIVIGTRGSDLALWQAREAARLVPVPAEIRIIRTTGDQRQDIALQGQLEQGFFTKEIERHLLAGEVDVAVHSLKDLPTTLADGLAIGAHLPRAAISDLLIINPEWYDPARQVPLKPGCPVGAMSLRRQALLGLYAPHVEAKMIRGNVPTRIERCRSGEYGAIVLARAGAERLRLSFEGLQAFEFNPHRWPPAPGQGAVAVEARADDAATLKLLAAMDDTPTRQAVELERRLLANYEGGCHTAFAAWAQPAGSQWRLSFGLERDGRWLAAELDGQWEELLETGPGNEPELSEPDAAQEGLCRPVSW
jgi:hydroxymethylbilane synthase